MLGRRAGGRGWVRGRDSNRLKELRKGVKGSWLLCGPETPFIQYCVTFKMYFYCKTEQRYSKACNT